MSASQQTSLHLLTAEEFAALPREGLRLELIRGEIAAMPPAFGGHGKSAMRFGSLLGHFVMTHRLGEVYAAGTGFLVARDPDTVRAPDAPPSSRRADSRPRRPQMAGSA
jgi:Uma2 family endonuclease